MSSALTSVVLEGLPLTLRDCKTLAKVSTRLDVTPYFLSPSKTVINTNAHCMTRHHDDAILLHTGFAEDMFTDSPFIQGIHHRRQGC